MNNKKMQFIIGLDLSTKCTGYSLFDLNGNLIEFKKIKPKTTYETLEKINYIVFELVQVLTPLKNSIQKIIIEDIYLAYFKGKNQVKGFANLGRLSGAVMSVIGLISERNFTEIVELRMASVARPLVDMKGNCQKAEVQVWALKNFTDLDVSIYEGLIEAIQAKKIIKDIDHKEYKNRMLKVSKLIEFETDFSEDISDAILLGYGEVLKGKNETII